jgi:hypothetical protein
MVVATPRADVSAVTSSPVAAARRIELFSQITVSLFGAAVERVDRVDGVVGAVFTGSTLSGRR